MIPSKKVSRFHPWQITKLCGLIPVSFMSIWIKSICTVITHIHLGIMKHICTNHCKTLSLQFLRWLSTLQTIFTSCSSTVQVPPEIYGAINGSKMPTERPFRPSKVRTIASPSNLSVMKIPIHVLITSFPSQWTREVKTTFLISLYLARYIVWIYSYSNYGHKEDYPALYAFSSQKNFMYLFTNEDWRTNLSLTSHSAPV